MYLIFLLSVSCYISFKSLLGMFNLFLLYTNQTDLDHLNRLFVSYVIDLGTHGIAGSASWRIPVGLQMLWGLILLSGIFFLPESPYVVMFPFRSGTHINTHF